MIKAGIIGCSGYAGSEVLRWLLIHPEVEVVAVSARSYVGKKVSDLYPSFRQYDLIFVNDHEVIEKADIIFAGLPHGASQDYALEAYKKGKKFIDLGADFRLDDEETYTSWYGPEYNDKQLHSQAVYGLPEIHRDEIKDASIIGNPGCYPTSIILGLYPLLKTYTIDQPIIIHSSSGVTGAGKGLSDDTHFPKTNESYHPYKVGQHRHTPEIEQELSKIQGNDVKVTFVPYLLPVNRGIVSAMYIPMKDIHVEDIYNLYVETYKDEQFVRVLPLGQQTDLKFVQYSNYCDISIHIDTHTSTLIIVSAIDNMVKGTAGQAIQNMNIMYGLEENTGLEYVGPSF